METGLVTKKTHNERTMHTHTHTNTHTYATPNKGVGERGW